MTADLLKQPVIWVDSDNALEKKCEQWRDCDVIALDTEFIRTNTYYPVAGLIQINDGVENTLIDPTAIEDWYPLIEVLDDDKRIVAMHACSEDLELLQVEIGTIPRQILDTQVAAAFIGHQPNMGYGSLVKEVLDIDLPKSETRSDWLQRPLSKPQIHYAALDVEFLRTLALTLIKRLKKVDRLDWVLEEGVNVYKQFKHHQSVTDSYKKVKSAWKLNARKLAVLIALSRWREDYAQSHNLPRNRVIKEKSLFDIALHCPTKLPQLRKIEGLNERIIRKQGKRLINIVQEQLELAEEELPSMLPPPLDKENRELLKQFKAAIADAADTLGIAAEMLLRKKDIEKLIRMKLAENWQGVEAYFSGWRKSHVADKLIVTLKEL